MNILCTHPGRLGDIFWSLAACRSVAEQYGTTVDFATSPKYAAVLPIVQAQPYIRKAFKVNGWDVEETAPMTPSHPPVEVIRNLGYDQVLNLGYTRWPELPLAFEAAERHAIPLTREDLSRPWITLTERPFADDLVVGFTDEYFELKYGIYRLLRPQLGSKAVSVLAGPGSRWATEGECVAWSLEGAAQLVAGCAVFLGCLSALAVLAAAMGKPRVLVEPNPHRHHRIFQHWDTPLVKGNDGLPTFDARHVAQALKEKLEALP